MPALKLRPLDNKKLSERFRRMARELPNAVDAALREAAEDMRVDYYGTVLTWEHDVDFEVVGDAEHGYGVATDDEVWNMLEHGTRAHVIEAKDKPLAFYSEYQAKTRAGSLSSQQGGSGGDLVFVQSVNHPGTKPRKWHDAAYKRWRPRVAKYVRDAIKYGMEAIGI